MKKYRVTLTRSEVELLEQITSNGKRSAQIIRNAYILLNCNADTEDKQMNDEDIAGF